MIKNYLLTAIRHLRSNKTNSFLNIFGLAIGIACAGLIFLWVEDEINFDSNNQKKENLSIVRINAVVDNGINTHSSTPGVMGPALSHDIPAIAATCRMSEGAARLLFTIGDRPLYASGNYAEPSIFNMFTLPFVEGNARSAFSQLYSLVITEKTAKKFFGGEKNLVGRTVRVDGKQDYVIGGVLKDLPANSSLQFEWLAPFQVYYQQSPWARKWDNYCVSTFVEVKPGVSTAALNQQLYHYLDGKGSDNGPSGNHPFLFGMKDWHLRDQFDNGKITGGGGIRYVRLFSAIAWIILLIACINFMNLATARSEKRAREVGVRKVLGAVKNQLVTQFIGEALLMAILAAFAAVLIIALVLPPFNWLVQKDLSMRLDQPIHIISLLVVALVCGLVAGSYPSLYLSSFNPIFVLKGIRMKTGSAAIVRKGLVILQFTVSIVLITSTIIIYQQVQHIKNRDLGFKKDNLVQMDLRGDMRKNFTAIKQDLINTGAVENAAMIDRETLYGGNNTSNLKWQGKDPNSVITISQRLVSPEYMSTVGLHIAEGRDFQQADIIEMGNDLRPKDKDRPFNVIVTQSFEKLMGEGSALGKWAQLPLDSSHVFNLKVVGVVKDYVYGDMYGKPTPVVFYCLPQLTSLLYIRTNAHSNPELALSKMAGVLKKNNPSYPFEYKFVDDQFNDFFTQEMLISRLSRVFAALAILISCLGLFGLAAYTAERRTKEIGIRKVLGATVTGMAGLLSKDFLLLVLVSCLIAFPIAWWTMHNWLKDYAYRIDISWWIFAVAGAGAILIALATVSFQAIRAALANPVKSLRSE
jgi:putative ABC transport system permease protein